MCLGMGRIVFGCRPWMPRTHKKFLVPGWLGPNHGESLLMNSRRNSKTGQLQRTALALALGLGFSGLAFGQATTGSIFGQAQAGDTVMVKSTSGVTRQVVVDPSGHYTI